MLRNLVTDALQALWQFGNSYRPILPILHKALAADAARGEFGPDRVEILDLCSGGSGPWLRLAPELARSYGLKVHVRLSDKYPNFGAFSCARERSQREGAGVEIGSVAESVDATNVPAHLSGFLTIFSAFHHFGPELAEEVLRRAAEEGRGIGIFEVACRGPRTMLTLCVTPFLLLLLTPFIRPFRWSRLFWTFVLPVVPFVIWYDGMVSCLRTYSQTELWEMVEPLTAVQSSAWQYVWQVGETHTGLLPVTYLVGYPTKLPDGEAADSATNSQASSQASSRGPKRDAELEPIEALS